MQKSRKKKGFTLTELAIVIAVIAILIAVLVPTFTSLINKARESSDSQLAKNMNTLLTIADAEGNTPETMEDVNYYLTEGGYLLENLNPSADGNVFVWNKDTNCISYIDEDGTVLYAGDSSLTADGTFTGGNNYWLTVKTVSQFTTWASKYTLSYYVASDAFEDYTITLADDSGIDTGSYPVGAISYVSSGTNGATAITTKTAVNGGNVKKATADSSSNSPAIIRGEVGALTINSSVSVKNYATIKTVTIDTSATGTYTEVGSTTTLTVSSVSATVVIENNGYVNSLVANAAASYKNSGYVYSVSGSSSSSVSATTSSSYSYTISTYNELASFRDKVNNGNPFDGITIELTADIDLGNRTWVPIGYDSRDNTYSGAKVKLENPNYYYFGGIFKGNNNTIMGLTNTGFTPTTTRQDTYGAGSTRQEDNYLYGLFGILNGAEIYDLKLTDVNIVNEDIVNDSVGAIAGYACGSVVIENCTVSGSIEGGDAVGGIVGRILMLSGDTTVSVEITNCTNNATIVATKDAGKAAGIIGYYYNYTGGNSYTDENDSNTTKYYGQITISNCTNKGSVTATSYAAGIMTGQQDPSTNAFISVDSSCSNSGTISATKTAESVLKF